MTLEACLTELGRLAGVNLAPMTPEALTCDETSDPANLCADPQVSVFIPMYNLGPRLDEALAGVMAQDADFPFEVVLCDDCSTDDTVALAEAWVRRCPEKVRLLRARQNAGALRNRLRAQHYCRASWIALLDGDDLWTDPGKLRKQLPLLRKSGTVMAVAFSEVLLPDDKREVYTCPIAPFVTPKVFVNRYLQTSTYVYSRAAAEEALRRWPGLPIWDDLDIYYRLAALGRVALLPEPVSVYRRLGDGMSSQMDELRFEYFMRWRFLGLFLYGPPSLRHLFLANLLKGIRHTLVLAGDDIRPLLRETATLAHARAPWSWAVHREWRKLRALF